MMDLSCTQPGSSAIRRYCSDGLRLKLLPRLKLFGGLLVHKRADGLVSFAERQEDLDDSTDNLFELGAKFGFSFLESGFDVCAAAAAAGVSSFLRRTISGDGMK